MLPGEAPSADPAEAETEVFYTFTWAGRGRGGKAAKTEDRAGGGRGKGRGAGKGKSKGKPAGEKTGKASRPHGGKPRKEDRIDPDNPFAAALMGLKDKG